MGILTGRTALVVGASSGVGYGCALRFAEEGADVVACARRLDRLQDLAALAEHKGFSGQIVPTACDVEDERSLDHVVELTIERFGQLSILACIAQGGLNIPSYLAETTPELARHSYQTGPLYTMLLMQKCFPHMKAKRYGRIITCASGSAVSGTTGFTAYAMAKAAIMTLTRKAAQEWAQYGIVSNCILPVTKTDHYGQTSQGAAALAQIERVSPVRYLGDAYEDCSPIVAFIASEGARYLNGQMIGICGGLQVLA